MRKMEEVRRVGVEPTESKDDAFTERCTTIVRPPQMQAAGICTPHGSQGFQDLVAISWMVIATICSLMSTARLSARLSYIFILLGASTYSATLAQSQYSTLRMEVQLEQSVSFRPFMKHLIAFAAITGNARYYKIANIVRRTFAGNGDNVVNLMFAPGDFLLAVVTFAFLSIILFSNLFSGVLARNGIIARSMFTGFDTCYFRVFSIVTTRPFASLFFMFVVVLESALAGFLSMRFAVLFTLFLIFWQCFIMTTLSKTFFRWNHLFYVQFSAWFAHKGKFLLTIAMKVFRRIRQNGRASTAFFVSIWDFGRWIFASILLCKVITYFASGSQFVRLVFIGGKEFKSWRLILVAAIAMFQWYTIHTDELTFHSSRSGMFAALPEHQLISTPHYSMKWPEKQVQWMGGDC